MPCRRRGVRLQRRPLSAAADVHASAHEAVHISGVNCIPIRRAASSEGSVVVQLYAGLSRGRGMLDGADGVALFSVCAELVSASVSADTRYRVLVSV